MSFDMPRYLRRIGYDGRLDRSPTTLRAIHLGHATHIPFENLDIHLGRPIKIDLPSVFAKLVDGGRGGYCFEHNTLLAAALEEIGFEVTRLGARVGAGDPALLRRTHMILKVRTDGTDLLADAGFGAGTLLEPIPIAPEGPHHQHGRTYRVETNERGFVLQSLEEDEWRDQYHFTLEEMFEPDYEIANHFTSTHPDSGFVRVATAQRQSIEAQWILRGTTLTEIRDGKKLVTTVEEEDLVHLLRETFGLSFPAQTRFRSPLSPDR